MLTTMNRGDVPIDLSQVYHSLSASRRCHVIRILESSDENSLSVRSLAREVTSIEEGVPRKCATGGPYHNVYNALSQTHLSTLSEADIIIYDSDRQMVAAGPNLVVASLILVLNKVTYQTLQGHSVIESVNFGDHQ